MMETVDNGVYNRARPVASTGLLNQPYGAAVE